ncbi:MAG TPA: hypothetical protein VGR64_02945 [Terracidiphilus sp.]|nr:hypothetical protein [Terracidiphilus sp.]
MTPTPHRAPQTSAMNPVRGFVMLLASVAAFFEAWRLHSGPRSLLALLLGVLALALALWHLRGLRPRTRR